MPRPIIIDTDPSPDDAVAILVALASPDELDVLAVTTVAGNVPISLTSKNARKALELAKRTETPVYAGASAPLVRKLVTAEHVHGRTGFDGYELPEPTMPLASGFAPEAIVDLVMRREARRSHVMLSRAAHQYCSCLSQRATAGKPRQGDRGDGRRIFGRREYYASGGIQHLCRSRGGESSTRMRCAYHDDPIGLHSSGVAANARMESYEPSVLRLRKRSIIS